MLTRLNYPELQKFTKSYPYLTSANVSDQVGMEIVVLLALGTNTIYNLEPHSTLVAFIGSTMLKASADLMQVSTIKSFHYNKTKSHFVVTDACL